MLYFFLLHILTASVFCVLLFFKKESHGHCAKLMSFVMLLVVVMTFKFMEPGMLNEGNWKLLGYGDLLFRLGAMTSTPALGIYFIVATTNKVERWQWWALFGPALLVGAFIAGSYLFMSDAERKAVLFFTVQQDHLTYHTLAVRIYRIAGGPCYIFVCRFFIVMIHVYCLYRLTRYYRSLFNYFSDHKGRPLLWSYGALGVLILYFILLIVPFGNLSIVILQQSYFSQKIIIGVFSEIYIVLLGIAAWRMRYPAASFVAEAGDSRVLSLRFPSLERRRPLPSDVDMDKKWTDVFLSKRLFTQPHITIDDVAREMHVDRVVIIRFLYYRYGMHFYHCTLIARIRKAKSLLKARPKPSLEQVAQQCGYPDVASFRRAYRFVEHSAPK
jgi:AraC-like DNA-binding protein